MYNLNNITLLQLWHKNITRFLSVILLLAALLLLWFILPHTTAVLGDPFL
jgi:hypothetical protein